MWAVRIERGEARGAAAELHYPWRYSTTGAVHVKRGRGPVARAMRGAGNTGHGASPTASKREGFSF
jgi:hypothetical protein